MSFEYKKDIMTPSQNCIKCVNHISRIAPELPDITHHYCFPVSSASICIDDKIREEPKMCSYYKRNPSYIEPEVSLPPELKAKVQLYFTVDETVSFAKNLSFILAFCDVPPCMRSELAQLVVYLENAISIKN